jgi:hypothetical protein
MPSSSPVWNKLFKEGTMKIRFSFQNLLLSTLMGEKGSGPEIENYMA